MVKSALLFFVCIGIALPQALIQKSACHSVQKGGIISFAILKSDLDNKMYFLSNEIIDAKSYLLIYDEQLKPLMKYQAAFSASIQGAFIKNNNLYFIDNTIKYISLSDLTVKDVNTDRKKIRKIALASLDGKDILVAQNKELLFLYTIPAHKELLNIAIKGDKNNFEVSLLYNGSVYYSSESDQLTKFSIAQNKISWQIKFPEKPVRLLGIKLSSLPNWLTSIEAYTLNGKDYISAFLGSGDSYRINAENGKLLFADKEFEVFNDIQQNNAKLFVSTRMFQIGEGKTPVFYAGSIDKSVYCLYGTDMGDRWETPVGNEVSQALAFYDMNQDAYPEVFGVTDYDNTFFVLDGKSGKIVLSQSIKTGTVFNQTRVYLADLYGKGILNVIVMSNRSDISIFEYKPEIKAPVHFIYPFTN